jgi:hypothetical protein
MLNIFHTERYVAAKMATFNRHCHATSRGSIPGRARKFLHNVHTGYEVYPASYTMGAEGYFPEVKAT